MNLGKSHTHACHQVTNQSVVRPCLNLSFLTLKMVISTRGGSTNFERGEYSVSAQSSSIANARIQLYTRFVFTICHGVLLCSLNTCIVRTAKLFLHIQVSLYRKRRLAEKIAKASEGRRDAVTAPPPPLNPPLISTVLYVVMSRVCIHLLL